MSRQSSAGAGDTSGWAPGQPVGRFTLVTSLARGGMAEIWLARQSGLSGFEKLVVIKRMVAVEENSTEMFLTEARLAAQLTHPHVVQIFELGEHAGSLYIVMEYLDGEDLAVVRRTAQRLASPLPDRALVRLCSMAAEGLHYAHTLVGHDGRPLRIVHRDISPQNLIATFDGGLKVVDFGIAKPLTSNTFSGKLKGKLSYMAPEQARGEPLDARADVYALGITLFECVTGTRLLPKMNDLQVLEVMAGDAPWPRASERRADIDAGLDALIDKALQRRQEDRFQTARELQEALDEWSRQQGKAVSSGELADTLRNLFANRIHERRQLIEAAMSADLTPEVGQRLSVLVSRGGDASSSRSRTRATGTHSRGLLASVVAMVLVVGGLGAAIARKALASDAEKQKPVVAAPSPAPAPQVGALTLDTVPSGAELTLDGVKRGPAPLTIEALSLGSHEVVATKAGYEPARRTLTLEQPGEKLRLELALSAVEAPQPDAGAPAAAAPTRPPPARPAAAPKKQAMGNLSLKTTPWTTVFLGAKKLGDTPLVGLPLPAGKHTLRLVQADGSETSIEVSVEPDETTMLKLKL